jgi:hypothetical protein
MARSTLRYVLPFAGLLVTGCAGSMANPYVWQKPGGTQEAFAQDKYRCMGQATQMGQSTHVSTYSGYGYSVPTTTIHAGLYQACMEASGWQLAP